MRGPRRRSATSRPRPGCPSGYLIKEKKEFPHGDTIDVLDAWSYITDPQFIKPETPETIFTRARKRSREEHSIAGYGPPITYESS